MRQGNGTALHRISLDSAVFVNKTLSAAIFVSLWHHYITVIMSVCVFLNINSITSITSRYKLK